MNEKQISIYVKEYFEDCELRRRLSAKTIKAYKIDLKQYFCFIGTEIDNSKKIIEYILWLNQKYSKHKTVKRKLASVKAFYTYLEYEDVIGMTPFRKIRTQVKEPKLLPKTISSHHLNQIFGKLYEQMNHAKTLFQQHQTYRNIAVIELLFSTGIRISELCHIKQEDIDIEEQTLKIFGKGSKERLLYIGNNDVVDVLKTYSEIRKKIFVNSQYFFVNKYGEKLSDQSVRLFLKKLEDELEMTMHITPHMFRHTFATSLLEKDVDIRYIQKILGHSSISVTQIYTHVSYPKQKEILSAKNPMNDYHIYHSHLHKERL